MRGKQKINSILSGFYLLYVPFLLVNLQAISSSLSPKESNGVINYLSNIEIIIPVSVVSIIFEVVLLSLFYYELRNIKKEIIIIDNIEKERVVNKKLMPYKIFIVISIIVAIMSVSISKTQKVIISGSMMVAISTLICYGKSIYIKFYLYDRKLQWLESMNGESYKDLNIDTKKWRYKIWFSKKEKIKFRDRKFRILSNLFQISIFFGFFLAFIKTVFDVFFAYFLIYNILYLIENIFGLYTSINGICTEVYETKTRNNNIKYNIVVTNYNKKQEVRFSTSQNYYINELDNLELVHGIFTKQVLTMNNIVIDKPTKKTIIYKIITFILFGIILYPHVDYLIPQLISKDNEIKSYEQEAIEYIEKQKSQNVIEKLPLDAKNYEKVISVNKEDSFNNVTIKVDKLYLGKNESKLLLNVINNSDKGMVINVDYNTHIKEKNAGENSNILLPKKEYYLEMDIPQKYNKRRDKELEINFEYTLSEHIIFDNEYMDYSYYNYYPLNVIDSDCYININLENETSSIKFNEYDKFYNKTDEVVKFIENK